MATLNNLLVFIVTALTCFPWLGDCGATGPRTSPPADCLVVRQSGMQAPEYSSVSSAVAALDSGTTGQCIFIYGGNYTEQVSIKGLSSPLAIYGYTTDGSDFKHNTVTISHYLGSHGAGSPDASSTVWVSNNNVSFYNVNIENTYTDGQAVAYTGIGLHQGFYGCGFKSYQDTLYAKSGMQYYSNCYIEGTIASSGGGYITASSRTYDTDQAWYVIDHSVVTAVAGASVDGMVFLGRPWRPLARVIYQYSTLTGVVHPEGWAPMAEGATPIFMEYENTGAGSNTSARLYETPASIAMTKLQLWDGDAGWYDKAY
ncbi:pectin lyase fold/virulence factor [Aspergillus sergii]|uniref:pectinesterase n=1 Tax=Aspergillus sergii TaxID=1034303 RepID=A0A5N6WXJ5_9EURO|nr:pectin lyase fold/virulence factor [Aspergillus sergii]